MKLKESFAMPASRHEECTGDASHHHHHQQFNVEISAHARVRRILQKPLNAKSFYPLHLLLSSRSPSNHHLHIVTRSFYLYLALYNHPPPYPDRSSPNHLQPSSPHDRTNPTCPVLQNLSHYQSPNVS